MFFESALTGVVIFTSNRVKWNLKQKTWLSCRESLVSLWVGVQPLLEFHPNKDLDNFIQTLTSSSSFFGCFRSKFLQLSNCFASQCVLVSPLGFEPLWPLHAVQSSNIQENISTREVNGKLPVHHQIGKVG